ncbi:MAG: CDP-diacylglycerol--serine O-phosphatidyltransferase [Planctomycetota bacterium]
MKLQKIKGVAILPTLLTLGNLLCGFFSIVYVSQDQYKIAAILIFGAMGFDALDGRVARLTKTASNFGIQMDSLADLVSFGLAPAFMVYSLIATSHIEANKLEIFYKFIVVIAAFYLVCVALRLARFNIEAGLTKESHEYFIGLPSPGAGGFLASTVLLYDHLVFNLKVISAETILLVLPFVVLLLGVLMVSRFRYTHIGNSFARVHPFIKLLEVLVVALFIAIYHQLTLFIVFLFFILSGPVIYTMQRISKKPVPVDNKLLGQAAASDESSDNQIF